MTQFNTTLTTTAPRKVVEPITVRLMKSATALRERCAAWFTPFGAEEADLIEDYEARAW